MKEINRVFFGEKGITSTSANHLANLAKECMESNRRALEGVGFITSTVRLLNGGEDTGSSPVGNTSCIILPSHITAM